MAHPNGAAGAVGAVPRKSGKRSTNKTHRRGITSTSYYATKYYYARHTLNLSDYSADLSRNVAHFLFFALPFFLSFLHGVIIMYLRIQKCNRIQPSTFRALETRCSSISPLEEPQQSMPERQLTRQELQHHQVKNIPKGKEELNVKILCQDWTIGSRLPRYCLPTVLRIVRQTLFLIARRGPVQIPKVLVTSGCSGEGIIQYPVIIKSPLTSAR